MGFMKHADNFCYFLWGHMQADVSLRTSQDDRFGKREIGQVVVFTQVFQRVAKAMKLRFRHGNAAGMVDERIHLAAFAPFDVSASIFTEGDLTVLSAHRRKCLEVVPHGVGYFDL